MLIPTCTELTEASASSQDSMPSLQTVSDTTASDLADLMDETSSVISPTHSDDLVVELEPDRERIRALLDSLHEAHRSAPVAMPKSEDAAELGDAELAFVRRWLDDVGSYSFTDTDPEDTPAVYDTAASVDDATAPNTTRVDLYDSGASHHMSPYRDLFISLTEMPPRQLNAANQQHFEATGEGDMIISVPNDGADDMQIWLT